MKSIAIQTTPDELGDALSALKAEGPDLLLLFTAKDIIKDGALVQDIRAALPDAHLVGCSTAGEIGETVEDGTVSLLGLKFDATRFKCMAMPVNNAEESDVAGAMFAENLLEDDLKGIFVLAPGHNINGTRLTAGMRKALPRDVIISGGLAGDGNAFKQTITVLDDTISDKQLVGFGLYGDAISIHSGSRGGWKPFGPMRRVTRASGNILYEIDGKPALQLYKEYLGEKAAELPASGLLYPLAIMDEKDRESIGLIRTILDIDEDDDSLVLAGELPVGSLVSLMHGNTGELALGAELAAREVMLSAVRAGRAPTANGGGNGNCAAICVSSAGRKVLMGDDTEEELDAIREVMDDTPITGFYAYGEICPFEMTGYAELHNQTMTITYLFEHER